MELIATTLNDSEQVSVYINGSSFSNLTYKIYYKFDLQNLLQDTININAKLITKFITNGSSVYNHDLQNLL
jgi:hypothetical protein